VGVVGAGVALALALVGCFSLSLRRTRLTVVGGQLVFTGFLRKRVVLTGTATGRVVKIDVDWGRASGRRSRLWLLVNSAGAAALCLNRSAWDDRDLEALRARLALPIETVEPAQRPAELRKVYPGAISWWGAHPVAVGLFAVAIIAAVMFAVGG
jgi:multidrug efflux pump subunit AcrA (membrane-fusion protein)